ncbi:hypothetical protein GUF64_04725 [Xanthomonas citri pv. citri]|nr:hypothetical protein [Xanthomonas citri pv. citri]
MWSRLRCNAAFAGKGKRCAAAFCAMRFASATATIGAYYRKDRNTTGSPWSCAGIAGAPADLANEACRSARAMSRLPRLRYKTIADNVVYPFAVRRITDDEPAAGTDQENA